ncbi:Sedoheptulokinase [Lamellibrachia satsuma]|nr:Sedoheptulokinase [Lamellibrachia satsuma]
MKRTQLRWSGHLVCMTDDRIPKVLSYGQLKTGCRTRGGQRKRYKDVLKSKLKSCSIPLDTWETTATNRPLASHLPHPSTGLRAERTINNQRPKNTEEERLSEVDFPIHLLPPVHDPGTVAGHTSACWYSIPEGTPVTVAIGDLQCSTLARLKQPEDAVLNISTSAQLAIRMNPNFIPPKMDTTSSIEYFPLLLRSLPRCGCKLDRG